MSRKVLSWTFIIFGLSLIVSGIGGVYIGSIFEDSARQNAAFNAQMDPYNFNLKRPQGTNDLWIHYVYAVVFSIVGASLMYLGMRLRTPAVVTVSDKPRKKKKSS